MPNESIFDRMFWPVTALAVFAVAGTGIFVCKVLRKHPSSSQACLRAPISSLAVLPTQFQGPIQSKELTDLNAASQASPIDSRIDIESMKAKGMRAIDSQSHKGESPAPITNNELNSVSMSDSVTEQTPGAHSSDTSKEDVSPYLVPDNHPYITRETFMRPSPEITKKAKPVVNSKVVVAKDPPAIASMPSSAAIKEREPLLTSAVKVKNDFNTYLPNRKVLILNDGRRILVDKVIEMGDAYGVKDSSGQLFTIYKKDISSIARP